MLLFANFSGANLDSSEFSRVTLDYSNLSNVIMQDEVFINNSSIMNSNLQEIKIDRGRIFSVNLSNSSLISSIITKTFFLSVNLNQSNLSNANLSNNFLILGDLSNTDLSNTNFKDTAILGTDLLNSKGLDIEKLEGDEAPLLCNTRLSSGTVSNRDCEQMANIMTLMTFINDDDDEQELNEGDVARWKSYIRIAKTKKWY